MDWNCKSSEEGGKGDGVVGPDWTWIFLWLIIFTVYELPTQKLFRSCLGYQITCCNATRFVLKKYVFYLIMAPYQPGELDMSERSHEMPISKSWAYGIMLLEPALILEIHLPLTFPPESTSYISKEFWRTMALPASAGLEFLEAEIDDTLLFKPDCDILSPYRMMSSKMSRDNEELRSTGSLHNRSFMQDVYLKKWDRINHFWASED
ncbi:hypothetical protein STEG23_023948, partial [Scotinomys teguina]